MNLSYSFHLGNDKNKSLKAKKSAKNNLSGTTSQSNNAIQNSKQLAKVCKHDLRLYELNNENICVLRGSSEVQNVDVKEIYLKEFEESRLEYNAKQTRKDRMINNYFDHISNDSKHDLACELIIELGDMDYWSDKDFVFKSKMIKVYEEQIKVLESYLPEFKIANAVIHLDENSPHMHIIGVPVKEGFKNGMKKQVGKTTIFTKESLTKLQDYMRTECIKSFNETYNLDYGLKLKQEGRNEDIAVSKMEGYKKIKKERDKIQQNLDSLNDKSNQFIEESKDMLSMYDNLKPLLKNNYVISKEQVDKLKSYTEKSISMSEEIKSSNDVTSTLDRMEKFVTNNQGKLSSANRKIKEQSEEIDSLNEQLDSSKETIKELRSTIVDLKKQLSNFINLWNRLLNYFRSKFFGKDENANNIVNELHDRKIFSDDNVN